MYTQLPQSKTNRKHKLTGINDQPEPKRSTTYSNILPKQKKRPLGTNGDSYKPAKRSLSHNRNDYNPKMNGCGHLTD